MSAIDHITKYTVVQMSEYQMGRLDYLAGLPPIPDENPEDAEYMRGYNKEKAAFKLL